MVVEYDYQKTIEDSMIDLGMTYCFLAKLGKNKLHYEQSSRAIYYITIHSTFSAFKPLSIMDCIGIWK